MSQLSELFDLVGMLARRRRQLGERCFATLGLNHTEARLLTLLEQENGESTQDALSNKLFIDRSNSGRALKGLESSGYVIRAVDASDKRTRSVQMTTKGRAVVAEIARLRKEMADTFFGKMTNEEAGLILNLLRTSFGESEI